MAKNLLIVESPAKAKTIEKILGKDFTVKSSYGHVRDLDKEGKNKMAIDIQNGFRPHYVVTPDKLKVVRELKDLAASSDEVWLATDEDREGEAISWHLAEVLGLDVKITKRIVFREITKPAITKAVQSPRFIDMDLVNAQQARRVLDRLVGFELSELLWKKVKGQLSAGRVQSVAVKLVVEREREIQHFKTAAYFKITAIFQVKNAQGKMVSFKADGPERFAQESDAESFLQRCIGAAFFVRDIRVSPTKRKPAAPFTTSTLQQEAGRKLGFSVNRTMSVAQRLYEAGHITYMRTDSTNLSETAITSIAEAIEKNYGQRYVQTRRFKTNKAGAQEAHEAIRPTYIEKLTAGEDKDEQRLYELIWKRTIASQMADAELEKTVVDISISTIADAQLTAEGEVLRFDGFLKVYLESTDDDDDDEQSVLPPLERGQELALSEMNATERFTRPPARFSEPSLVKKMEELGIGRPSTYAPTITKIMEETRGYVRKENRDGTVRPYRVLTLKNGTIAKRQDKENVGQEKNKLFATDMGFLVVDFLDDNFKKIMDYGFTAGVEDELDRIAEGKVEWATFLETFYHPFHMDVEKTLKESERVSGERILGIDPKSGRTILVRMSRLGKPVVQIGKPEELAENESPKYGNLKPGQNIENITLDEALSCFDLPKILGELEGKEVSVGAGRYGPYVKLGDAFISLPKGEDPHEVTLERALEIIEEKRKADAPIGFLDGKPITKGSGRFGPFVKWDDLYVNIPKSSGFTILTITEEGAIALVQAKREKESTKFLLRWEEEDIAIEIGRYGPFIRAGKQMFRLPPGFDGKRMEADEAAAISLTEVKKAIAEQGGMAGGKGPKKKK